jgi:hypothetical protein
MYPSYRWTDSLVPTETRLLSEAARYGSCEAPFWESRFLGEPLRMDNQTESPASDYEGDQRQHSAPEQDVLTLSDIAAYQYSGTALADISTSPPNT